jgi:hypothetical protein
MSNEPFSEEKKFRWIAKVYFGVLDSPKHDVNPFDDIPPFLEAKVKQLEWGKDPQERASSKQTFCRYFMRLIELYDFYVPEEEIMKCINNEEMKNKDVVSHFSAVGTFTK